MNSKMVVLQKSDNQIYTDIVRSLKQNFRPETQPSHEPAKIERKVRIRTNRYYRSELTEDDSRAKFNRREKQTTCGFYTPAHVAYTSVGDLCLDLRDLVVNTVGFGQSSEKCSDNVVPDPNDREKKREERKERKGEKKKKSQRSARRVSFAYEDQGGMSEIKAKLSQYRERLAAVRAGQTFEETAKKEHILSMVVDTWKEQRSKSITPSTLQKMFNKFKSSAGIMDPSCLEEELIPAFPSEIKSEHEEESMDHRDVHERYIRNFGGKLSGLYSLLCYIYHLRTRDLRTRVPLSREFMKTLKTEVLTDQKGRPLRHTRNMAHFHPQSRGAQRSSTDATVSRMEHDYHMSPHMNTRSSFVSDSPSSLFRTGITGAGAIESRTSFFARKIRPKDTSDKIETWEDLLEAGEKPPAQSQGAWGRSGAAGEPGARGGITRTSFMQSIKMIYGGIRMRRYGILQHAQNAAAASHSTEPLPIWHQVAAAEKKNKENGTTVTLPTRRTRKSSPKAESPLSELIGEGFGKIQAKCADRVKEKLIMYNRTEKESFLQKVLAFNPTYLYSVDLQRIRQVGREVLGKYVKQGDETANWYGELEKEAQELGVAKEPDVIDLLNQLYPLAIDDVETIPYVQAKLCLVVQSLPVYELCSLPMMDALKILLVKILNCSPGTFNEWMNQRKLLPGDKAN